MSRGPSALIGAADGTRRRAAPSSASRSYSELERRGRRAARAALEPLASAGTVSVLQTCLAPALAGARRFVPQPEASSSITPLATSRSHSRRWGGSAARDLDRRRSQRPRPAPRPDSSHSSGRRLDERPFELDVRHRRGVWRRGPVFLLPAGSPTCLRAPARSGSATPAGTTAPTRPGIPAGTAAARARPRAGPRSRLAGRRTPSAARRWSPIWKSAAFGCSPLDHARRDQAVDVVERRPDLSPASSRTVSSVGVVQRGSPMRRIGPEVATAMLARHARSAPPVRRPRGSCLVGLAALQRPPDDRARHLLEHLVAPALGLLDRCALLGVGREQRRVGLHARRARARSSREPWTLRPSIFIAGTRLPAKPSSSHQPAADHRRQVDPPVRDALVLEHQLAPHAAGCDPGIDVELRLHAPGTLHRRLVLAEHLAHHVADLAERGVVAQRVLDRVEQVAARPRRPRAGPPAGAATASWSRFSLKRFRRSTWSRSVCGSISQDLDVDLARPPRRTRSRPTRTSCFVCMRARGRRTRPPRSRAG